MSNSSGSSSEDKKSLDGANVFQVGFNISLPGKPGANFDIVFNEKGQAITQVTPSGNSSLQALPSTDRLLDLEESAGSSKSYPKSSVEKKQLPDLRPIHRDVKKSTGAIPKQSRYSQAAKRTPRPDPPQKVEMDRTKTSPQKDKSIIEEIKSAMGNFERFSEHLKEIPRFSNRSLITSTPFADRSESRSEGNLTSFEGSYPRKSTPRYDYIGRHDYYRPKAKPPQTDLFLKPLPAEDYFKKGAVNRYIDLEPYRHYGSESSLTRYNDYGHGQPSRSKSRSDSERYDGPSSGSECYSTDQHQPPGILKKTDSDNADKLSTSSADSVKDIKIYQSGGILIMQNFNENLDMIEKKDISDISAKLIENCNRLKDEIHGNIQSSDECQKPLISNSSDEVKTKVVQFDLSTCENLRSKSADSLSDGVKTESRNESSENKIDYTRSKDTFSYATAQSQDFPSLSTQENDSLASTALGMSPTSSTSGKKLEWDSGADVGYLNLDLRKENLSTIERIILKGLSNDGKSEKRVIYEKKPEPRSNRSKFILERMPSELVIEEITEGQNIGDGLAVGNEDADRTVKTEEMNPKEEVKTKDERKKEQDENSGKMAKASKPKKTDHEAKREEASKKIQTSKRPEKVDRETNVNFEEEEKVVESRSVQTKKEESKVVSKAPDTVNKSTNVDTLFSNYDYQVPIGNKTKSDDTGHSESSNKYVEPVRISPRVKRLKKKKVASQGTNLTSRLKDKIDSIIDIARNSNRTDESCRHSSDDMRCLEMGIPKRIHRRFEGKHCTNEVELCKDFEEIIIDQRFKIKQNVNRDSGKSNPSSLLSEEIQIDPSKAEKKTKTRPVSASSSSNMTVFANPETVEEVKKVEPQEAPKFTDQTVQTVESKYESIGIQAFDSRKSSISIGDDLKSENKTNKPPKKGAEIIKRETDIRMTSSKNIQASGTTSSLPKHLEHPKETNVIQNQNTKSTQFFGGPINSLPNYHSNLITKPNESCSRMPKSVKTTTNSMRENRINQASRKNSVVTDIIMFEEKKEVTNKSGCKNDESTADGDDSDKKKMSRETTSKSSSDGSKDSSTKDVKESDSGNGSKKVSNEKESSSVETKSKKSTEKRKEVCESTEGTEFQSSDDVKSKLLTSEMLREHGDSVDRSIIQEKYFRSQLIELEKKDMVSRSTSMDRLVEHERNTQTTLSIRKGVTIGCQYSPQHKKKLSSKEKKSEKSKGKEEGAGKSKDKKEEKKKLRKELSTDQYDSSQNMAEDENFGTLESTNQEQGFETNDSLPSSTQTAHSWVPGMQNPNQNLKNVVGRTGSFEYLPGHIYESSGNLREELPSETEHNLISESTSGSSESGVSKRSTSDGQKDSEGVIDIGRSIEGLRPRKKAEKTSEESKSSEEEKPIQVKKTKKPREIRSKEKSAACQTEALQSVSDSERFYQERKELERRIDEEKENHIKCIQNQIEDLNFLLKGLMGQQEDAQTSNQRKKKQPQSLEKPKASDVAKTIFAEVHPRQESPAQGNPQPKLGSPIIPLKQQDCRNSIAVEQQLAAEIYGPRSDLMRYGMKVSVTGGPNQLQQVTMMPVGVQVTLKDKKAREECFGGDSTYRANNHFGQIPPPYLSSATSTSDRRQIIRRQIDVDTQYPSLHKEPLKQTISTQVTDSLRNCSKCNQSDCVCLKNVEEKKPQPPVKTTKEVKVIDEEEFCRSIELVDVDVSSESFRIENAEKRTTTQSDPSVRVMKSTVGTTNQKSKITSAESSSAKCNCSEFSGSCSKCVCKCHEKPLPRCKNCNYLMTCKKCQCYKNIKCCECVKECKKCARRDGDNKKNCCANCRLSICANCERNLFIDEACKICRCSKAKEQNCKICKCHAVEKPAPKPEEKTSELCKCHQRNLTYFGKCKCEERNQRKSKEKVPPPDHCVCPCCEYFNEKIEEFGKNVRKSRDIYLKQFQNSFPSETRSSSEVKSRSEMSSPYEEKIVPETKKVPSAPEHAPSCPCPRNREKKNSASIDGHPRHYFLKIEETEDDSIESVKNRKSLEVITVKVPVKRCGKGKKYGEPYEEDERRREEPSENRDSRPFQELLNRYRSKECTCSRCRQEGTSHGHRDKEEFGRYRNKQTDNDWRSDSRPFQDLMNRCRLRDDVRLERNYETNGYRDHDTRPDAQYRSNGRNFDRPPTQGYQERDQDRHAEDYLNFNKREFMTKSEIEREEKRKKHFPTLQECLETNRPDVYNNFEYRRHIISERSRERERMHDKRVQNLAQWITKTINENHRQGLSAGSNRIFTTVQMKEQTMKRYKHLPEVTNKEVDRKKKEEYRTNKLMADIFAKRLQTKALKGHVNLSNSFSVLASL